MNPNLSLTEDELVLQIGSALQEGVRNAQPASRSELLAAGHAWLRGHNERFCIALCGSVAIRTLHNSGEVDLLFHAVCEAITTYCVGVPVGFVAAYLVKRGIQS